MRRSMLALALLLIPTAAWADWGATKWGMTLEQVLDAVPGAKPLKREGTGSDVWKQQRLASAQWKDGEIALVADFFFDPDAHTLTLVKMQPNERGQCAALADMLVARYGAGKPHEENFDAAGVTLMGIRWTDPATRERLLYSRLTKDGEGIRYCHLIVQMPA